MSDEKYRAVPVPAWRPAAPNQTLEEFHTTMRVTNWDDAAIADDVYVDETTKSRFTPLNYGGHFTILIWNHELDKAGGLWAHKPSIYFIGGEQPVFDYLKHNITRLYLFNYFSFDEAEKLDPKYTVEALLHLAGLFGVDPLEPPQEWIAPIARGDTPGWEHAVSFIQNAVITFPGEFS